VSPELRHLRAFLAVCEEGTFTAGAERLFLTQEQLSRQVAQMEDELGVRLFERTTRSVRLTTEGRAVVAVAREIVRDFRRALDRLAAQATQGQGRITVAALPSVACAALPAALDEFRRGHPAVDVVIHDVQHERALSLVTEGVADFAITIKPPTRDDVEFDEVASDATHLVCRADDPLARRKQVRWRDLAGMPFIGMTGISSVRRLTDAAFVHAEVAVAPRYQVEQIPSAVAMVEAGLGVTALPALTFPMFKGRRLAMRPLIEPRLRRNIGFVRLAGRALPERADALMRALRASLLRELRGRKS
jgi:DNA-binding transcriptional LysR family regulator